MSRRRVVLLVKYPKGEFLGEAYPVDTPKQIERAKRAMRALGLYEAPVYIDDPKRPGFPLKNGETLKADP